MNRIVLLVVFLSAPAAHALDFRGAVGLERSSGTTVLDRDCSLVTPPALFGCVEGNDGRPLAARGDFGTGEMFEIGVGTAVGERGRVELALSWRPELDLDASADFPGVSGSQPVHAGGRSLAAMLIGSFAFGTADARLRPYLLAGAGMAHNTSGAVTYAFPTIAPQAVTVIAGGSDTSFAWTAGAGVTKPLTDRTSLDVAIRYTDLGEMRTDDGDATIIRPTRVIHLDIAGTRAPLETVGLVVSLRARF